MTCAEDSSTGEVVLLVARPMAAQQAVGRALAMAQDAGSAEDRLQRMIETLMEAIPQPAERESWRLSERQTTTLRLLAQGYSNRAIARRMEVAEETVKCHVRALLDRLRVPNRTALALWAVREGVVPLVAR